MLASCTEVEFVPEVPNNSTLLAIVQKASIGDEASEKSLTTNIEIDVAERILKAGHQTKVALQVHNGALYQNGIALAEVYENTFRYTTLNSVMRRRSEHETKNLFVFEQLLAEGLLEDYDALVFSQATEDPETLVDYNFFVDTATCSVQLLKKTQHGLELQTALVAGKVHKNAPRHDTQAITVAAARHGATLHITTVDDTVSTVLLVPKNKLAGVEAIVQEYDIAAGGTFYGQAVEQQDYTAYAEACYSRSFETVVQNVKQQMLAEAHLYTSPLEVIQRLDYLSERYAVQHSVHNSKIDAAVFGTTAAFYIEQARMYLEEGNNAQAEASLRSAQKNATSGSCPLYTQPVGQEKGTDGGEKSKIKRMNCPDCDAVVYDDPCARVLKCWDCKAMVINGKKHEGNGGSKARMQEKLLQKKNQESLPKKVPVVNNVPVVAVSNEAVLQPA